MRTSRERILNAALPVFARKGRFGAHMEEIASLAHINKAMIYYIFHGKDELYYEVLKHVLEETLTSFSPVAFRDIKSSDGYAGVISNYITSQLDFFSKNGDYTRILVDAMSSGAEEIQLAVNHLKSINHENDPMANMKSLIEKGKSAGFIRDVDTDQLMISMIGMIIIHFFSQSITTALYIEVRDEKAFLEKRRESVIDLVLNSILTR